MTFTLRQLRYAQALAQAGHFGRAAERVNISQPALSQQIRQLEEACGEPLFDRLVREVRLTPFGREFLDRVKGVLDGADDLTEFVNARSGTPNRPLRFGLIPTVAPYLLPDIFPALQAEHPAVRFTVSESRTEMLLAGLAEGAVDLALVATEPPAAGPRLVSRMLFEDPFMLAASRAERLPDSVPLAEIDGDRLLLLDEGHCLRDQAIAACALQPDRVARTFAATSLSTIIEFVANGQGVTLLPSIALRKEAANPNIRVHRIGAPGAGRTLRLLWREASPFGALFEAVAQTIRKTREATASR